MFTESNTNSLHFSILLKIHVGWNLKNSILLCTNFFFLIMWEVCSLIHSFNTILVSRQGYINYKIIQRNILVKLFKIIVSVQSVNLLFSSAGPLCSSFTSHILIICIVSEPVRPISKIGYNGLWMVPFQKVI